MHGLFATFNVLMWWRCDGDVMESDVFWGIFGGSKHCRWWCRSLSHHSPGQSISCQRFWLIAGIHQVTTHPLYSCATATGVPSHARYHTPCLSKRCVFSGSQWQRFVLFLQVQIFWIGGTFQSQCLASLLRSADAQCRSCALLSWPQRRRRRTKPKVRCDSYSRNFGKGSSLEQDL